MNGERGACLALVVGWMLACAQGATDGVDDDGAGASDGGGGAAATGGHGPASTTTGGMAGGGAGDPMCLPPEHLCGDTCVGNTPSTGCYQSTACTACPAVVNGTTKCDDTGLCDFDCHPPYAKSGSGCACPVQCCTNSDCGGSASCQNGQCVQPCDDATCILMCFPSLGVCLNGQCTCF
jgi:hypothetical protein